MALRARKVTGAFEKRAPGGKLLYQHGGQGFTINLNNLVSQSKHFNFVTFDMYFYFHTYKSNI